MSSSKLLLEHMADPLPGLTEQKRMCYRPDLEEVHKIYDLINQVIFKNKLIRPEIQLGTRRMCWGLCMGYACIRTGGSYCVIKLSNKWYCKQWLVTILAHEMAHQYQWDVIGPARWKQGQEVLMSHGPSFFVYRNRMLKYQIPLKITQSKSKWFRYQLMCLC